MRIARELFDEIVAHARQDAPNECCGIIASRDGEAVKVYRAVNAAGTPRFGYEIDGSDLYRIYTDTEDQGLVIGAIYHSHPRSEPVPSQADINLARWPDSLYVIIGLEKGELDVRAFTIRDVQVTEADLEVD